MEKLSKKEAEEKIESFFAHIKNKTPEEIRKIKRLSMRHNLKLKELRKKFCKKCFNPYKNPEIRLNKNFKSLRCRKCGYISRWKIKLF
jgi:RNase P subunit RPR2